MQAGLPDGHESERVNLVAGIVGVSTGQADDEPVPRRVIGRAIPRVHD